MGGLLADGQPGTWAWPAGGLLVGLGMCFAIVSTFSTKMDPWSWTPTNPENFKARRTGFWASRHGWGGREKRSERPRRISAHLPAVLDGYFAGFHTGSQIQMMTA